MSIDISIVLFEPDLRALRWTLEGIGRQTLAPETVRILINAGTDGLKAVVDRAASKHLDPETSVQIESRFDNLGFAAGQNELIKAFLCGTADFLLILNPDVHLDPDCTALLAGYAAETDFLVGPLLYRAERAESSSARDFRRSSSVDTAGIHWTASARHLDLTSRPPEGDAQPYLTDAVSGAAMMTSRSTLNLLMDTDGEVFDESFFAYREDAELGLRAGWYGIRCAIVPRAFGWHVRNLRGTTRRIHPKLNMLGVQNRYLLALKWGRFRPGSLGRTALRDSIVLVAVITIERGSIEGLRRAIRTRRYQRSRGRRVRRIGRKYRRSGD